MKSRIPRWQNLHLTLLLSGPDGQGFVAARFKSFPALGANETIGVCAVALCKSAALMPVSSPSSATLAHGYS